MKIIQILIGPQNNRGQNNMFGLSDDGDVYKEVDGFWEMYIARKRENKFSAVKYAARLADAVSKEDSR